MVRVMAPSVKRSLNPRVLAAHILQSVDARPDAFAGDLLAEAFASAPDMDPRDRALATELVQGVLRWQGVLDARVREFITPAGKRLEYVAETWLRLGAYQVAFLGRMPREIAVSATIDAAREAGLARLGGLLNAILRRFSDAIGPGLDAACAAAGPDLEADVEQNLRAEVVARGTVAEDADLVSLVAARAGLPRWIVGELVAAFLDEALDEALALRRRGGVTLRPTVGRGGLDALLGALERAGLEGTVTQDGLVALKQGDPFRTEAWFEGLCVAQDVASYLVIKRTLAAWIAANPNAGAPRVLDMCAGRGIKATGFADLGAEVVAADVSAKKLDGLMRLARRLGVEDRIIATIAADGTRPDERLRAAGPYDIVLVDAPCSGLGTISRHPEIVWRRTPEDVGSLHVIQQRLFEQASALVKPGGFVAYAVCTFVRVEGELSVPSHLECVERVDERPTRGGDAFMMRLFRDIREEKS